MRWLVFLTALLCSIGISQSFWTNKGNTHSWKMQNNTMKWFPAKTAIDCMEKRPSQEISPQQFKTELCKNKNAGKQVCFCSSYGGSPMKYNCGTCELQLVLDWKSVNKAGVGKWGKPGGYGGPRGGHGRGYGRGRLGTQHGNKVQNGVPTNMVADVNNLVKNNLIKNNLSKNNLGFNNVGSGDSQTFMNFKVRSDKPGRNRWSTHNRSGRFNKVNPGGLGNLGVANGGLGNVGGLGNMGGYGTRRGRHNRPGKLKPVSPNNISPNNPGIVNTSGNVGNQKWKHLNRKEHKKNSKNPTNLHNISDKHFKTKPKNQDKIKAEAAVTVKKEKAALKAVTAKDAKVEAKAARKRR